MKKLLTAAFFAFAAFCCAAGNAPLIQFDFKEPQEGKIEDKTGNAVMVIGKSVKLGTAFGGSKSLEFDGTPDSVCSMQYPKVARYLDGFEYSIAFQVRFDQIKATGSGLGLSLRNDGLFNIGHPHIGPGGFSVFGPKALTAGKWHQVAMTYSRSQRNVKLFLDGDLIFENRNADLFPLQLRFNSIGGFKGAIANLTLWNYAVPQEELTETTPDETTYTTLIEQLNQGQTTQPGLDAMRKAVTAKLNELKDKKTVSIAELDAISRKALTCIKLFSGTEKFKGTSLEKAPCALLEVKTCSNIIRTPDMFPPDGVFTDKLSVFAAKGERTSFSFVLSPYENVKKLELLPGDFKGDNGSTLPASILDRKVVKCWYQPNWNSYWNSAIRILVPDLLLNDDTLVKVDTVKQKNFLRIEYRSGTKYCDINETGNSSLGTAKEFNFLKEPVRDAKEFQPVELIPGENKQFVFNVRVPRDAKAGIYHAPVKLVADGKEAGSFEVTLRVYPFELPRAATRNDLSIPFICYMTGTVDYSTALEMTGNPAKAEEITRANLRNLKDYQILYPAPSLDEKDLQIHKEEGFDLKPFFTAGSGAEGDFLRKQNRNGLSLKEYCTKEFMDKTLADFEKSVIARMDTVEKIMGHREVYFYGFDEADSPESLAPQVPFREILYKHGGKLMTSGWCNNLYCFPSYENLHSTAALIDKSVADQWHGMKCLLTSYAAPFAGPDNPDLMRRSHGLEMYLANYDGWFMLYYCNGMNIWNDQINGRYRNFMSVYVTPDGPVNSLAFTGLGEGQEDIRFMTLLKITAEECFKSDKLEAMDAAKRALLWMDQVDATKADLDQTRRQAAEYILEMMKLLGKEVNK